MPDLDRNSSVSVGTDNVVVSEAVNTTNSQRISFSIINTSTGGQNISLAFTDEAGAGKGITLAVGGFYSESIDAGFTPRNSRISAISDAAGGTLSVSERLRVRE